METVWPWVNLLPVPQRRVLLWLYQEAFSLSQLALVLGQPRAATLALALDAYRAFTELLRANGWGADDDLWTFPPCAALVGLV